MAEAEDVITDVARHATVYVQGVWRRHRGTRRNGARPEPPALADVARRLDLIVTAVFGRSYPIRVAQPPAPPSLLSRLFCDRAMPRLRQAVPATDGTAIWLPPTFGDCDPAIALDRYRTTALPHSVARRSHGCATSTCCSRPMPPTRRSQRHCPAWHRRSTACAGMRWRRGQISSCSHPRCVPSSTWCAGCSRPIAAAGLPSCRIARHRRHHWRPRATSWRATCSTIATGQDDRSAACC